METQTNSLSDNVIVKQVLLGEKELFSVLMRRHNQKLYRIIRGYLTDERDISDAMQETYLKAYQKLEQFRAESEFSTWLLRIGINEALGRIRREKRGVLQVIGEGKETKFMINQIAEEVRMNPEHKIINEETRILVQKAIDLLPEKYRVVYIAREIEGFENDEISKILDISITNVKVRFHRAKRMLKEQLYSLTSDAQLFEFGNIHCDRLVESVQRKL